MKKESFDDSMFDIVEIKEQEDGSANVIIDVSDEFVTAYKIKTGKKRATKKGISKYIQDHLQKELLKKMEKNV
jgi:hypothetical protein